jgi:micrococcal nuclease
LRRFVLVVVFGAVMVYAPPSASAAVCANYANQADAQRAADTTDADGDGIYCEALPCPCLRAGTGGGGGARRAGAPPPRPRARAQVISARITSVVDGDTIKVKAFGAQRSFYTVRLIGIDTPETHRPGVPIECGGKRATASMLRLSFSAPLDTDGNGLEDAEGGDGRRVTLTTDPTQDRFDRYGRLLAYVTTRSGTLLQTAQVARGLAVTYVYGGKPFQRLARFRAAEARARSFRRGVWGLCGGRFHSAG